MINLYQFNREESKVASKIFRQVMKSHGIPPRQVSVDITMVTNEEIRELNRNTRNIDRATDVLSFPTVEHIAFPFNLSDYREDISPEDGRLYLGEIVISRQIMTEQAEEYGHSVRRECAFLITHGLLHLLGYDHIDELDMKVMRAKEEEILEATKYYRE